MKDHNKNGSMEDQKNENCFSINRFAWCRLCFYLCSVQGGVDEIRFKNLSWASRAFKTASMRPTRFVIKSYMRFWSADNTFIVIFPNRPEVWWLLAPLCPATPVTPCPAVLVTHAPLFLIIFLTPKWYVFISSLESIFKLHLKDLCIHSIHSDVLRQTPI